MKRFLPLLLLALSLGAAQTVHAQTPTLSIADGTTVEGNSGARELLFPVTLSSAQTFDVSASFKTHDNSATAPRDYTPQLAGQVVIKAGKTRANVLIRVLGDKVEEKNETFLVQLGAPKRCAISDSDAIGTIVDEDYGGKISVTDTSFTELNSGQKVAKVQVTVSPSPLHPITVSYKTGDDSAKASKADYIPTKGKLLFKPARTVLTVAVPIVGDTFVEADEKCLVRIEAPGYNIAKSLGTITIVNDDAPPKPPTVDLSIGDTSLSEGNGNQISAQFTVTLAQPASSDLSVNYATQDGTAKADSDYLATSGTLTFKTGETTAVISVPLVGDATEESDESFSVKLSAPDGLTGDTEGIATVKDDDYAGQISIEDASAKEGNQAQFSTQRVVSLSSAPLHPLEFSYATQDGTALSGSDYVATLGTLQFKTGQTTAPVPVTVLGDDFEESDETFTVTLSAANLSFAKANGTFSILNDDVTPPPPPPPPITVDLSVNDISLVEGDSSQTPAQFTVTLTQPAPQDLDVSYTVQDGTAQAKSDYVATTGTLRFKAGETSATIPLLIVGDTTEESDEAFSVKLSSFNVLNGDTEGIATIKDNDYAGQISITDQTVTEGNSGTTPAVLAVTLSPAPLHDVEVSYTTAEIGYTSYYDIAKAQEDYGATTGNLLFTPGTSRLYVSLPIVGDTTEEFIEAFLVKLSSTVGLSGDTEGIVAIKDNDYSGQISIADVSVTEGNSNTTRTMATLTVNLSSTPLHDVEIGYTTQNATATAPDDYIAQSGTLLFRGQKTATIQVPIVGDTTEEGDETFTVTLSAPDLNFTKSATVSILDDDYAGQISINDVSVTEGNSGQTPAQLVVSLSPRPLHNISVAYATKDGTAIAPTDYTSTIGTLLFTPSVGELPVTVTVVGDTNVENNETLSVSLTATGYTIAKNTGTVSILNDDIPVSPSDLNGKIAFTSTRDGNAEIYSMNADGTAQTRLTNSAASDTAAAWSPDGKKIAFQSDRDGNLEIYVMDADGSNLKRLTNNAATDSSPAWSPDGQKILFESSRSGKHKYLSLFVMDADGKNVQPVPTPEGFDRDEYVVTHSAWAPGSGRIGYDSQYSGSLDGNSVVTQNADGTARSNPTLTAVNANYTAAGAPAFSPDGARIAYPLNAVFFKRGSLVPKLIHDYQIYVMNADGSGQTRLTKNSADDQNPSFSPDGKFIAFDSTRSTGIFVIRDDGSGEILLVADGSDPSWVSGTMTSARKAASAPKKPSGGAS